MALLAARRLLAAALALPLTLTACAEKGGASGGGGASVEYGASKQEYRDALADMSEVTLVLQSTAPKGAATGRRFEAYAEAVEDWSGGKIRFDIVYSNAIAPPEEVDEALADGRLDVGSVLPMLDPSEFPANNVLWDVSFLGRQTPVEGILQWHGAMLETAAKTDSLYDEYADRGIQILLPAYNSGSFGFACADNGGSLEELDGGVAASQSRIQNREAEAIGLSPASVTYAEMYESLQRGVVDCAVTSLTVAVLGGFIDAAPHFTIDPDVGFAVAGGAIGINKARWEELPLAAEQLLYDRLDVLLEVNFEGTWDNIRTGLDAIDEADGELAALESDTRTAVESENRAVLEEAARSDALSDPATFVSTLTESDERWLRAVQKVGIEDVDVSYAGFRDWWASHADDLDLQPYFEKLWQTAMSERRPS